MGMVCKTGLYHPISKSITWSVLRGRRSTQLLNKVGEAIKLPRNTLSQSDGSNVLFDQQKQISHDVSGVAAPENNV